MNTSDRHLFLKYVLACLTFLCGLPWASTEAFASAPEPIELALIVGNNTNVVDSSRNLRYADDDAIRVANAFLTLHPKGALWLLVNPDAETGEDQIKDLGLSWRVPTREVLEDTVSQIRQKVKELRAVESRPVRLFYYFSGHGETGATLHLQDMLLQPEEWKGMLASVRADDTFILMDACYGGQALRLTDVQEIETSVIPGEKELKKRPSWLAYIGATTPVPEVDRIHGGLLTLIALNGLLGLADLDGDERISFYEWSKYVQLQVSLKPDAPRIAVVKPTKDPLTTVVDLSDMGSSGLIIEKDFPSGHVEIDSVENRALAVHFYHHKGRRDRLMLPSGKYSVVRYLEQLGAGSGHVDRVHRAASASITVDKSWTSILDGQSFMRPIVMIPKSQRGTMNIPPGTEEKAITDQQEQEISSLVFRTDYNPREILPAPAWALSAWLDNPWWGLDLGTPVDASGNQISGVGFNPGGGLRLTQLRPMKLKSRWLIGWGPLFQVSTRQQRNLYVGGDSSDYADFALLNELRIGPALTESWNGRLVRTTFTQSVAYAPSFVTAGRKGELSMITGDSSDSDRYLFLRNFAAEASFALMVGAGKRLEVGPVLRADLELVTRLAPDLLVPQVAIGLEFRQRLIR